MKKMSTGGKITLASVGSAIAVFIAIYGFLNNYIDGRVTNHPAVQQSILIQEQMKTLKSQVEELKTTTNQLNGIAQDLRVSVARLEASNANK